MTVSICIIIFLILIVVALGYHESAEWKKLTSKALTTGECPFCGMKLNKYTFTSIEGARDIFFCKTCDFSVSTEKVEKHKQIS